MTFECKICSKKFDTNESLEQHIKAKHVAGEVKNENKRNTKKYFLLGVFLLVIILFVAAFYVRGLRPGKYDDFAKCLTDKGAVIYGNDFCSYTNQQRNGFGKSKKYLNYVKCIDNEELCNSKGVKITPTWEINGQMYEGVQNFEKLAALTRCEI